MFKEHQVVLLDDNYLRLNLFKGHEGTIVYVYPNKKTFEVEFTSSMDTVVLTLQHYQIKNRR